MTNEAWWHGERGRLFQVGRLGVCLPVAMTCLAACAMGAPTVKPHETLDRTGAYVFGRFIIRSRQYADGKERRPRAHALGLVLACEDGASYRLLFTPEDSVQVFKLSPSTCRLSEILDLKQGAVRQTHPPPPDWVHRSAFPAGSASYLGDYYAVVADRDERRSQGFVWDVDSADDRYEVTKAGFKQEFPALTALKMYDQPFAPSHQTARSGSSGPATR